MSNFIGIKTEWLTEWGLTPAEAVVYGYLYGWLVVRKDKTIPFRQTQEEMAKAVGMDYRKFKRHLERLVSSGCVVTERTGTTITYTLRTPTRVLNNEEGTKLTRRDKIDPKGQKCPEVRDKNDPKQGTKMSPTTLLNIERNINVIFDDDARAHTREGEDKKRDEEQATLGQVGEVATLADELRREIENGSQLTESAMRLYGMTADDLKEHLTWFCDKLRIDGVSYKSRSDFRRHFNNWLRIRAQQKILNHGNNNRHQPRYSAEFMARLHADITSGH